MDSHNHFAAVADYDNHDDVAGVLPGRVPPKNGTFMGFITVSKPATPGGEVDVAIAWRGTVFKEEWESNFGHDDLVGGAAGV
jgi:hypothetical protein